MKIIIEIPEKTNAHIRSDYGHGMKCLKNEDVDILCDAIYHGTPYKDRQHGEWIDKDYGVGKCWATCSECGESTNGEAQDHGFGYDYSFPNFCPNCGALMISSNSEIEKSKSEIVPDYRDGWKLRGGEAE